MITQEPTRARETRPVDTRTAADSEGPRPGVVQVYSSISRTSRGSIHAGHPTLVHRVLLTLALLFGLVESGLAEWSLTASMETPRADHTATLLPSGKILVAGGQAGVIDELASAEIYDPTTGTWSSTGSLQKARYSHTATLLPSGEVLVIGGDDCSATPELYDPETETWSSVAAPAVGRRQHTATLMPSGRILIVGGVRCGTHSEALSDAEMYDPETDVWLPTGETSNVEARLGHTATLLRSGRVLVVGGRTGSTPSSTTLPSNWIYDPHADTWWKDSSSLESPRYEHTATLLLSGEVLVTGGRAGHQRIGTSEIYDPGEKSWSSVGSMSKPRSLHSATRLPSGHVLVVGTEQNYPFVDPASSEVFDPIEETWDAPVDLALPRMSHTATLLPSGQVLIVGGREPSLSAAELYDPTIVVRSVSEPPPNGELARTATMLESGEVLVVGWREPGLQIYDPDSSEWRSGGNLRLHRSGHTATRLNGAMGVLIVGGNGQTARSAELWNPQTHESIEVGPLAEPRIEHTTTRLHTGEVMVVGGESLSTQVELYDPTDQTWSFTGALNVPRYGHTATLLPSGQVLVTGGTQGAGAHGGGSYASAEIYDPTTGTWSPARSMMNARVHHTATLLQSGKVLVIGGHTGASAEIDSEIYDPQTETWTAVARLREPRVHHSSTLLPSGKVLVLAGVSYQSESPSYGFLNTNEIYNPTLDTWTEFDMLETSVDAVNERFVSLLASGDVLTQDYIETTAKVLKLDFGWSRPSNEHRPTISSVSGPIRYREPGSGEPFTITGRFRGDSEGSSGTTNASAFHQPFVHLRTLDGDRQVWLEPDNYPTGAWDEPMTLSFSNLPPSLHPGPYFLTVVTGGIPSEAIGVTAECGIGVTNPRDQSVDLSDSAVFEVETQGALSFQWEVCHGDTRTTCAPPLDPSDPEDVGGPGWHAVPGATASTLITEPVQAQDSGNLYRVLARGLCAAKRTDHATLTIHDTTDPGVGTAHPVAVVIPSGGELWQLSPPDSEEEPVFEAISWTMSDNIRICTVDVDLLYSTDGGNDFTALQLASFDRGENCHHPGEETTSYEYP
ncbi:MAG: kelch repeat-containing protein [Acidobacteriota bacterium]